MHFESRKKCEVEKIFFKWTIEKYSFLKLYNSHINLVSEKFSEWHFFLVIYSRGNDMCVRLHQNNKEFQELKGLVNIRIQNGSTFGTPDLCTFSNTINIYLDSWSNVFNKSKQLLINDELIIHCEIEFLKNQSKKPRYVSNNPLLNLRKDFGVLFDTKEFSDVTILTADDYKIPVHKNILSVRCKVFAAMFKHPLKESIENCVTISDFNSDVVNEMLRFIYTGEVPNLKDMTVDLMAAAEKYQLDELKAMCAQSMSNNLSIETAPIVLKSAVVYNVEDLKSEAIRYIENNLEKVIETSNWKELTKTDENLISEAFINPRLVDLKLNEDTSKIHTRIIC